MDRRSLLAATGLVLAGCSEQVGPDQADEPTDSAGTQETTDVAEDILIWVSNGTATEQTVRLTVTTGGGTHVEKSITLGANENTYVDPSIAEIGDYELTVELDDGRTESMPFDIEEYDIRMGSNFTVEIDPENIRVSMEE